METMQYPGPLFRRDKLHGVDAHNAVELVLNPKVATLLTLKKITCETVGLG